MEKRRAGEQGREGKWGSCRSSAAVSMRTRPTVKRRERQRRPAARRSAGSGEGAGRGCEWVIGGGEARLSGCTNPRRRWRPRRRCRPAGPGRSTRPSSSRSCRSAAGGGGANGEAGCGALCSAAALSLACSEAALPPVGEAFQARPGAKRAPDGSCARAAAAPVWARTRRCWRVRVAAASTRSADWGRRRHVGERWVKRRASEAGSWAGAAADTAGAPGAEARGCRAAGSRLAGCSGELCSQQRCAMQTQRGLTWMHEIVPAHQVPRRDARMPSLSAQRLAPEARREAGTKRLSPVTAVQRSRLRRPGC